MLILSRALVVVEFLAILLEKTKQNFQNISGNHAATWRQKLAADFPSLYTNSEAVFLVMCDPSMNEL